MGKYSVPESIRKMRPQGTMVKNVKNHFYVYEYSSTSVKTQMSDGTFKWKTQNKIGPCIGQITLEKGFVRNGTRMSDTDITVFEFGGYFLIRKFATETYHRLESTFDQQEVNQIFVVAAIFVVEQFQYMKRISDIYSETVLAKWFPDIYLEKDALNTLYTNLGKCQTEFQQKLIDSSSKKIAIESHVITCSEESRDLTAFDYKSNKPGTGQIHWMTAYDVETQLPLCNEMINGADPDKTAIEGMFSRFNFENTLFLVDQGFNTAKDKALFSQNGNTYIVPMISGQAEYDAIYRALNFDKHKTFVYDKDGHSSQIYYKTFVIKGNSVYYHAFLDTTRQSAEKQTYIKRMNARVQGYSEEGLAAAEKDFGLFLLETNDLKKTAKEVFYDYVSRCGIEPFYNFIDNNLDFNALFPKDSCYIQGLGFIIQISEMICHDLRIALNPHNLSVKDVLFSLRGLKLVKERNRYIVRNENEERRQLCEKIHLNTSNHEVTN